MQVQAGFNLFGHNYLKIIIEINYYVSLYMTIVVIVILHKHKIPSFLM